MFCMACRCCQANKKINTFNILVEHILNFIVPVSLSLSLSLFLLCCVSFHLGAGLEFGAQKIFHYQLLLSAQYFYSKFIANMYNMTSQLKAIRNTHISFSSTHTYTRAHTNVQRTHAHLCTDTKMWAVQKQFSNFPEHNITQAYQSIFFLAFSFSLSFCAAYSSTYLASDNGSTL